ncbi:peritrophin-1-like [Bombus fervidus]|uniref:peritrophin-1-like n=1 Tax=Bombus fervidus TaxID=203811 RepID=UPI003AB82FCB
MKAIFVVIALLVAFASTTPPPECPSGHGQSAVFLPNPDDCTTFYHCDREEPLLMQCNEGLEFNPKLKVCDWPKKTVTCTRRASTPASPPDTTTSNSTVTASPDMAPVEVTV